MSRRSTGSAIRSLSATGGRKVGSLAEHRRKATEDALHLERLRDEARREWADLHPVLSASRTIRRATGAIATLAELVRRNGQSLAGMLIPDAVRAPLRALLSRTNGIRGAAGRVRPAGVAPESLAPASRRFDIVCLPIIRWNYRFQRPQQLLARFAGRGYRVFYVSPDFARTRAEGLRPLQAGVYEVSLSADRELFLVRDVLSPAEVSRFADVIEQKARRAGVVDAVTMVQFPFWQAVAEELRSRMGWPICYDVMDEHAGFPSVEPDVIRLEEKLVRGADLVLTTSAPLEDRLRREGARPVRIPNGVDFDRFSSLPERVVCFSPGRPVIGYIGAVAQWIDLDLVGRLARRRPDWTFVLVGGTYGAKLAPLAGLGNVRILGEIEYPCLSPILHDFDVAIIPFHRTPLTHATNPIKMYEYLAAGRPVVATPIPEIEPFSDVVYTASGVDEFESRIVQALAQDSPLLRARRSQRVRTETWDFRVECLEAELRGLFD